MRKAADQAGLTIFKQQYFLGVGNRFSAQVPRSRRSESITNSRAVSTDDANEKARGKMDALTSSGEKQNTA
jgi:hypothetical protein